MRTVLVLAAAAMLFTAAIQPAGSQAKKQAQSAAPSKDSLLQKAIQDRFASSAIEPEHFRVEVRDGVAWITGKTDVIQHKGVATRLAKAMGAKQVKNQIEVSERARAEAVERLAGASAAGRK